MLEGEDLLNHFKFLINHVFQSVNEQWRITCLTFLFLNLVEFPSEISCKQDLEILG